MLYKGGKHHMDYKDMVAFSNAVVCSIAESVYKMGINMHLLFQGVAAGFQKDAVKLLNDIKFEGQGIEEALEGKDLKEAIELYVQRIVDLGLVNSSELIELTEDKMIVKNSYCLLQPATLLIRKAAEEDGIDPVTNPPPCVLMAIFAAFLSKNLGKTLSIDSLKRIDSENACLLEMSID